MSDMASCINTAKTAAVYSWFTVANGKWAWAGAPPSQIYVRFAAC